MWEARLEPNVFRVRNTHSFSLSTCSTALFWFPLRPRRSMGMADVGPGIFVYEYE